jgi:hypothetical protein
MLYVEVVEMVDTEDPCDFRHYVMLVRIQPSANNNQQTKEKNKRCSATHLTQLNS